MNRAELADATLADQPLGGLPLRMEAIHERFHRLELGMGGGHAGQLFGLGDRESDRLLAKHVLAGLECAGSTTACASDWEADCKWRRCLYRRADPDTSRTPFRCPIPRPPPWRGPELREAIAVTVPSWLFCVAGIDLFAADLGRAQYAPTDFGHVQ